MSNCNCCKKCTYSCISRKNVKRVGVFSELSFLTESQNISGINNYTVIVRPDGLGGRGLSSTIKEYPYTSVNQPADILINEPYLSSTRTVLSKDFEPRAIYHTEKFVQIASATGTQILHPDDAIFKLRFRKYNWSQLVKLSDDPFQPLPFSQNNYIESTNERKYFAFNNGILLQSTNRDIVGRDLTYPTDSRIPFVDNKSLFNITQPMSLSNKPLPDTLVLRNDVAAEVANEFVNTNIELIGEIKFDVYMLYLHKDGILSNSPVRINVGTRQITFTRSPSATTQPEEYVQGDFEEVDISLLPTLKHNPVDVYVQNGQDEEGFTLENGQPYTLSDIESLVPIGLYFCPVSEETWQLPTVSIVESLLKYWNTDDIGLNRLLPSFQALSQGHVYLKYKPSITFVDSGSVYGTVDTNACTGYAILDNTLVIGRYSIASETIEGYFEQTFPIPDIQYKGMGGVSFTLSRVFNYLGKNQYFRVCNSNKDNQIKSNIVCYNEPSYISGDIDMFPVIALNWHTPTVSGLITRRRLYGDVFSGYREADFGDIFFEQSDFSGDVKALALTQSGTKSVVNQLPYIYSGNLNFFTNVIQIHKNRYYKDSTYGLSGSIVNNLFDEPRFYDKVDEDYYEDIYWGARTIHGVPNMRHYFYLNSIPFSDYRYTNANMAANQVAYTFVGGSGIINVAGHLVTLTRTSSGTLIENDFDGLFYRYTYPSSNLKTGVVFNSFVDKTTLSYPKPSYIINQTVPSSSIDINIRLFNKRFDNVV